MFPVHIICNSKCDHSSYLCTFLEKRNILFEKTYLIDKPETRPDLDKVAGLVFMGSPHSVNDRYPWIIEEIQLIQEAVEKSIPVMAVCFGAQLASLALGGQVSAAPQMEIGWHQITVNPDIKLNDHALNLPEKFEVFQWHGETFSIPEQAIPLFHGQHIKNQGFVYGNLLAMQFHLEMTDTMIIEWLDRYHGCLPDTSLCVQHPTQITHHMIERLIQLNKIADQVYASWLKMIKI